MDPDQMISRIRKGASPVKVIERCLGEDQARDQAFKRWFGRSKIVDKSGNPRIAYHATESDFKEFSISKIGSATDQGLLGRGFYFSTDPQIGRKSSITMPVYLKAENPLRLKMPKWEADKAALLQAAGGIRGHDSVILDYSGLGYNHLEIVVFKPTQIKSAIGNRGGFDPGNPDITEIFHGR